MKLHEIIDINDGGKETILTEILHKYKKSLLAYYTAQFPSEPVLMVVEVFNAAQYAMIVPSAEIDDAIRYYYEFEYLPEREIDNQIELINFQSITLKQFCNG